MVDLDSTFNSPSLSFSGYKSILSEHHFTGSYLPWVASLCPDQPVFGGKVPNREVVTEDCVFPYPCFCPAQQRNSTYLCLMVCHISLSFIHILNLPQSSFPSNYTLPNMEKETANNDEAEDQRREAEAPGLTIQMIHALHD